MKKIIFLLICSLNSLQILAQTDIDSNEVNKIEYAYYPMAFYTPETEFAFGAGGMIYTRLGMEKYLFPSKIEFSGYYTTNDQVSLSVIPKLYFGGSAKVTSQSEFIYGKEVSKFYGIGNQTIEIENPEYEIVNFRAYTEIGFEPPIIEKLNVGLIYEFTTNKILNKRENKELIDNNVLGSDKGNTSGFGIAFTYDNRNNVFYPTENGFIKARMIFMDDLWGSDFDYSRMIFDFRRYYDLGSSHIIAAQVYLESTSGDVPFFKLPALGGAQRMRGYFLGRYRDESYLTWQLEFRKMIAWRLGAVAFVGMGDVANKLSQFNLSQFKYSYGFGFRYAFDEKENLNIRMDIGFGRNTTGVYFALEEAF